MALMMELYFNSSDGKSNIHAVKWLPDDGYPKAILQISHGILEHVMRYAEFAEFMADNGYAVYGNDHLGHGKSFRNKNDYAFFADKNGWDLAVKDMHTLTEIAKADYSDVPVFLFGHSMGSFLSRTYLIKHPGELDGCILCGTGQQPDWLLSTGVTLAKLKGIRNGNRKRSGQMNKLCFGTYNHQIDNPRTAYDWLTNDKKIVDKYVSDEKCGGIPTVGLLADMLSGIKYIGKLPNLCKMDMQTPIMLIAGESDPVGEYGKGVWKVYDLFKKVGCKDLSIKLYPGMRHEILNETGKSTVYDDVLQWYNEKIKTL